MNSGKLGIAFVSLLVILSVAYMSRMAHVRPEPNLVEVINLKEYHDSAKTSLGYQANVDDSLLDSNDSSSLQPDTSETTQSLEEVIAQLDALTRQVAELQTQVKQPSGVSDSISKEIVESVPDIEQPAEQLAELEQQSRNAIFAETHQALNEEEYDADWATSVNDSLSNLITQHDLSDILIRDLHCGATLCVAILKENRINALSTDLLLENLAWQGFRLKARDRKTIDGTNDVEILIGRDGRQFGRNKQS